MVNQALLADSTKFSFNTGATMTDEQLNTEIREANLTYLMLAQSLIRKDKVEAQYRLGISEESANMIGTLSPAQIAKIAANNMLLCRFRMDDDVVWGLLTNTSSRKVDNDATTRLHASILMSGRYAEAM
jgi:flagellar transcriptional activator FlhD